MQVYIYLNVVILNTHFEKCFDILSLSIYSLHYYSIYNKFFLQFLNYHSLIQYHVPRWEINSRFKSVIVTFINIKTQWGYGFKYPHPNEFPCSRIRWIRFVYENNFTMMY